MWTLFKITIHFTHVMKTCEYEKSHTSTHLPTICLLQTKCLVKKPTVWTCCANHLMCFYSENQSMYVVHFIWQESKMINEVLIQL